jgi:hypothetical protein
MITEIKRDGKIISRSKNLRGIITRQNKIGVRFLAVQATGKAPEGYSIPEASSAEVMISFNDDSHCTTYFADFSIAVDFFTKRQKRWNLTRRQNTETHYSWSKAS